MKTSLALTAAAIVLAPAVAAASQPAQPAQQPQAQDPVQSSDTSPATDPCAKTADQAGKKAKDSRSDEATASARVRPESVRAVTRDTGDEASATPKKPKSDDSCDTQAH